MFQPRRVFSRDQLREMINAERLLAREKGLEWTCWRKFHCVEEAVGPNRCMFWQPYYRQPHCTIIATYVSYHTRRAERMRICNGHFEEELRRYNASRTAVHGDEN